MMKIYWKSKDLQSKNNTASGDSVTDLYGQCVDSGTACKAAKITSHT